MSGFRLFCISVALFVSCHCLSAQVYLQTTTYNNCTVIVPTKDNLIKLVNCMAEQFKSTMRQYRYSPSEGYSGLAYVYDNWSLDLFLDNDRGVGGNHIEFDTYERYVAYTVMQDQVWPRTAIQDLRESMRPYYQKTTNGVDYFVSEDSTYYYAFTLYKRDSLIYFIVKRYIKR